MQSSPKPPQPDSESGFVLIAVIFLTVALLITLAVAAPKIATSIQREKEIETIHRGEQYKRALQLYYRKFGSYPTSVDQLVETNQIRFLRKRYTDPLTGKDDWKPILYGQAHVRPLGFFGQPLSAVAGVGVASVAMGGMSSSMYAASASATDANGVPVAAPDGSTTNAGTAAPSGTASSPFSMGGTNAQSGFGSSMGSSFGSTPGSSLGSSAGSSLGSSPGLTTGSSPASATGSTFGSAGGGTSATTFGGAGPIVGFTLPVDKPSLLDYKKQTRYNHWEFNYDPMEDQMKAAAAVMGGGTGINNSNPATTANPMSPTTSSPTTTGTTPGSTGSTDPFSSSGSQSSSGSPFSSPQ